MTQPAIAITDLHKTYADGLKALDGVDLTINKGEIFALLGPNGAGKTTLINAVCGIVIATGGSIAVCGHDIARDYRRARSRIGLVPQELTIDAFATVAETVAFSRGLFGKAPDPAYTDRLLADLSLADKKESQLRKLSGGMKRRVLIAKALSHEPDILFLDEPTAGVDVGLRRSMWQQIEKLRARGVTIVLTTHYLEEAEEIADRIGIITRGRLILTEEKNVLMRKSGKKELVLELHKPVAALPAALAGFDLQIAADGMQIIYAYDRMREDNGVVRLLEALKKHGIKCSDFNTRERSLEDIFTEMVEAA